MFPRAANLLLSTLLVATMLWGGCVACPQFFQSPVTKKSCCDPAGHCRTTGQGTSQQKPCQFQQLQVQQKFQLVSPLAIMVRRSVRSTAESVQLRPAAVRAARWLNSFPESPHDKQAVLSTFLV